jgi:hypothetical protein
MGQGAEPKWGSLEDMAAKAEEATPTPAPVAEVRPTAAITEPAATEQKSVETATDTPTSSTTTPA